MNVHSHISSRPEWLPADDRVAERIPIHLPVFLIAPGGEPFSATVIDVSTHGFRIKSGYPATLGRFLAIDVPAFSRYQGWVAWAHTNEFGFAVAHPLPEGVVNHILKLAQLD